MKYLTIFCRILLGALFVFSGANILHPFGKMPAPPPGLVADYTNVMMASHWMKVIGVLQLLGGLLVLIGGTLPLGLCILCPITVNILCFHILLAGGGGIAGGAMATVFELVLLYAYRASFAGIFSVREKPTY